MTDHQGGLLRGAVVLLLSMAAGVPALAQSLNGYVELTATRADERIEYLGSPPVLTNLDLLFERLSLTYTQPLAPDLQLNLGGYFERELPEGTLSNIPVGGETSRLRPFARLRFFTPILQAELGFDRDEARQEFLLPEGVTAETRIVRDALTGLAGWFPDSGNFLQLRATHATEQDAPGNQLDREFDSVILLSQYQPTDWLRAQYTGSYGTTNDNLTRVENEQLSHNLRVLYTDSYLRNRVTVSADYNASRLESETRAQGEGDVDTRQVAAAGLSTNTDIPQFGPLAPNPALIDGNRFVTAGIDIGVPPPAGDDRLRNLGLDFGVTPRVNLLYVWVDRDVRPEVAVTLSWEIWVSPDNENWIRHQAIGAAPFGPFDDRFELSFATVAARYVKVVVAPLAPTIPFASEYDDLLVTELEAYERVPAAEASATDERTTQFLSFNGRARLLPVPLLFYDLNVQLNRATGSADRWSSTNALSASHSFSATWSGAARLANEHGEEADRERNANIYSVSVTAAPSGLLRATGILSGRRETFGTTQLDTDTLLFNVTAIPYTGVDVNLSAGGSVQEDQSQRQTRSALVNAMVGITPNRYLALNVVYQDASRRTTRPGFPEISDPNRAAELSLTLNPFPTLYAFASYRREERSLTGRRNLRNYNIGWSPFPYGSLTLGVVYNEYHDSDRDTLTRIWGPTVRWAIARASYIDLSYQETTTDSQDQMIDRGTYTGVLRIAF